MPDRCGVSQRSGPPSADRTTLALVLKFSVAGVPVEVRTEFWVASVVLAFSRLTEPVLLVEWIVVLAVSILIHELGHAVAFRAFGHRPHVVLYTMGGLTYGTPGVDMSPGRDILVSLAGPAAGLALGGLVWAISTAAPPPPEALLLRTTVADLLWVNIGWGLVNLLPIVPLDGGQVLRSVLRTRMAYGRADRIALIVSVVIGAGAAILAVSLGMTFAAIMAGVLAAQAFSSLREAGP